MNFDNPELKQRLAAEYVLGTLEGRARERFLTLLAHDPELKRITRSWESRLNAWGNALPPCDVPEQVWANIRARLGIDFEPEPFFSLTFWRNWAIAATLAAALLLGFIILRPAPAPLLELAVISTPEGRPNWLVRLDQPRQRLTVSTLFPVKVEAGRVLELWAVHEGRPPVSLGLLDMQGKTAELELSAKSARGLAMAGILVISLEPAGGSRSGQPSGPVIGRGKPVLKL